MGGWFWYKTHATLLSEGLMLQRAGRKQIKIRCPGMAPSDAG